MRLDHSHPACHAATARPVPRRTGCTPCSRPRSARQSASARPYSNSGTSWFVRSILECHTGGMSLPHALLGLLARHPASGYDLRKLFDTSLAFVWPATQSQLYAELTRLAE